MSKYTEDCRVDGLEGRGEKGTRKKFCKRSQPGSRDCRSAVKGRAWRRRRTEEETAEDGLCYWTRKETGNKRQEILINHFNLFYNLKTPSNRVTYF